MTGGRGRRQRSDPDHHDRVVNLFDYPAIGWLTTDSGEASTPVISGTLPASWGIVEIVRKRAAREFCGRDVARIGWADGSYRGDFVRFLDALASAGQVVIGTQLADPTLIADYLFWVANRV